jgi:hypothetical protein
MLEAYAYRFYVIGSRVSFLITCIPRQPIWESRGLPDDMRNVMIETLGDILAFCESIQLVSLSAFVRGVLATPPDGYTYNFAVDKVKELESRFQTDLSTVMFKHVPAANVQLHAHPHLFGPVVNANFPAARYDIEQAGTCLSLDCYTAGVMHLMRALEVALDAVGLGVGVPNAVIEAHNSWERLLDRIRRQMEANNNSGDPDWPQKRQFFVDAQAYLLGVKNAWRNPSMHLEKKYEIREAGRIFRAVRDFMEHLATHLNESGQFTP